MKILLNLILVLSPEDWSLVAVEYHGKMETFEKEENQKKFMKETAFVIAPTSSFGMGVNKNNVRVMINACIA